MHRSSLWIGTIVASIVALAGCAKLLDWSAFAESVDDWSLLPGFAKSLAAYAVPPLEVAAGVAWFNRRTRALSTLMMVALLSMIVVVVTVHWARNVRPDCNCYGKVMDWITKGERYRATVWPSGILLAGALYAGFAGRTKPRADPKNGVFISQSATARPGFTVLELLVVVLIVSLLAALLFPALRGGRAAARSAALHSNLRSAASLANTYAADWRDQLPFYFALKQNAQGRTDWGCSVAAPSLGLFYDLPNPFAGGDLWHIGLAEYAFASRPSSDAVSDPRSPKDDARVLRYSCSLMTHPVYWNEQTREGANQFVPSKITEAASASNKCAFMTDYPFLYLPDGRRRAFVVPEPVACDMSFLDGHAALVPPDAQRRGVRSGDGSAVPGWGAHSPDYLAGLHTEEGVRGRDTR